MDRAALSLLSRSYLRQQNWERAAETLVALASLKPNPFETKMNLARALMRIPHPEAAARVYEEIAQAQPDNRGVLIALAQLYLKSDPERSFACWSKLASLDPDNIEPLLQMARLRVLQDRAIEAKPFFAAVIALAPDNVEALIGLGRLFTEEDGDAAPRHFRDWAERLPDDATPLFELARLFQKRHARDQAETVYREILKRHPENTTAMTRLAQLLGNDRGKIGQALDLWRRVADAAPKATAPLLQRAALFERVRRTDEAEADYRVALERAPRDVGASMGLAKLLSGQERWPEAIDYFEAVHRIEPNRSDALLGMGRCLERLDRLEEALTAYEKVLVLDPRNVNALLYRGRMLWQDFGRPEDAIEQWRTACAADPLNAAVWNELVFILATTDHYTEALAALDAAEQALPAAPATWVQLANTAGAGQFDERAVAYFNRAIEAEPDNAAHRAALGFHYARLGILGGAFRHLLDSREMKPTELPVAKRLVETVRVLNRLGSRSRCSCERSRRAWRNSNS